MRAVPTILILTALLVTGKAFGAAVCSEAFSLTPVSAEELHTTILALAKLRVILDSTNADRANRFIYEAVETDYSKKEKQLLTRLSGDSAVNRTRIRQSMSAEIRKLQYRLTSAERIEQVRTERDKSFISSIRETGSVLDFHPVRPGKFEMFESYDPPIKHHVELTEPYTLAATNNDRICLEPSFRCSSER